MNIVEH